MGTLYGNLRDHDRSGLREMTESVKSDSHYPSRFRSISERRRSVKLSHMYLNGDVHTDRNVSVKSQFRPVAVAERECLTGRHGSQPVWEPARF